MQEESVKAFKKDLGTYCYKLGRKKDLEDKIQECYDRLGGVRAVDPSREPTHSMPNIDVEYALRDRISELEQKLRHVCDQIEEIEQILDRIDSPLKTAVLEVYAKGHTIRSQAERMFLSETGLRKRINKAIEKALID